MRDSAIQKGFSLVEVTLALGIAAFCLLAILALLPVGLNSNQASLEQTAAAGLARGIISDLRATPKTTPPTDQSSPMYQLTIPAGGTGRSTIFLNRDTTTKGAAVDSDADADKDPHYRATVYFSAPSVGQKTATTVRVLITWPGMADKTASADPRNFAGSYEITTALDRN